MTRTKKYTEADVCNMVGSLFVLRSRYDNRLHILMIINAPFSEPRAKNKPVAKKLYPTNPHLQNVVWYCYEIVGLLNDSRYDLTII